MMAIAQQLSATAWDHVPMVGPGQDLAGLVVRAAAANGHDWQDGDVVAIASKLVARAADLYVNLDEVDVSDAARDLAATTGHEPELVQVILDQSQAVSRAKPGVLITRHLSGVVCANAGVDRSNAVPPGRQPGRWVLPMPPDPDADAQQLRRGLVDQTGCAVAVVITDSQGRPFRRGAVGVAVGAAGLPALWDRRGEHDLHGRELKHTLTGLADQLASMADLVMGQAGEGRGVVLIRGVEALGDPAGKAADLVREPREDLYV